MIDYTELPVNAVRFEQLIREDYDVKWTGVGPDGGRDLIRTRLDYGAHRFAASIKVQVTVLRRPRRTTRCASRGPA